MKSASKFINLIFFATSLAITVVVAPHASAQLGIYNTFSISNRQTNVSNQNDYFTSADYGAGAYYDGHRFKSVSVGLDLRGSYGSNAKFGLVGFRAALHPKKAKGWNSTINPYAEFLTGGGRFGDTLGNQESHMFCEGVIGADIPIGIIDFRILEVGIGRTPYGNSTGTAYSGGDLWLVTESSGIVYRF